MKINLHNNMKQIAIDHLFLMYCEESDFQNIKKMCEDYPIPKKTIFSSFLNIINPKPVLNFFADDCRGFLQLCENGHKEIISYIISHPNFKEQLIDPKNGILNANRVADGFFDAAKNGHYDCANLLITYVNQSQNILGKVYFAFIEACNTGNLDYVKFLAIINNMNSINPQQTAIDNLFLFYCEESDFQGIKDLVNKHNLPRKNIFHSFLKIFKKEKPTVNFFADECKSFLTLCKNGHTDIVSYILNGQLFKSQLYHSTKAGLHIQRISEGFFEAAHNGKFECANLLTSYVNVTNGGKERVYNYFVQACKNGDIEQVKFLIHHPDLIHQVGNMINTRFNEYRNPGEVFVVACENGHLEIVKYLTSDSSLKEKINLDILEECIEINNPDIIRHLIFDLNLPRDHSLLSTMICDPPELIDDLCDKRELFKKIDSELLEKSQKENNKAKRTKI